MSLLDWSSFDGMNTADVPEWFDATGGSGGLSITTSSPRNGTRALHLNAATTSTSIADYVQRLVVDATYFIIGFGFRLTALPDAGESRTLVSIRNAAGEQLNIRIQSDGKIAVYRGSTQLGISVAGYGSGVWRYFEAKVTIDSLAGAVEVRINGSSTAIINITATDTSNQSADDVSSIVIGSNLALGDLSTNGHNAHLVVDDYYLLDSNTGLSSFLGDSRVEALALDGAGNYTEWDSVTGAATHREAVDDAQPDDDTSFISSATAGDRDTFTTASIGAGAGAVHAVGVGIRARKDDGGTRELKAMARAAATDAEGAVFSPGTSYTYFRTPFETKPAGGAWALSDVNGAEFGVKVQT